MKRLLTITAIAAALVLSACGSHGSSADNADAESTPAPVVDPLWMPRLDPGAPSMQPMYTAWSNTAYAKQDAMCATWRSAPQAAVDDRLRYYSRWDDDHWVTLFALKCGPPYSGEVGD